MTSKKECPHCGKSISTIFGNYDRHVSRCAIMGYSQRTGSSRRTPIRTYRDFILRGIEERLRKLGLNIEFNAIEAIENGQAADLTGLDNRRKEALEDLHDSFFSHQICPFIIALWGNTAWCQDLAVRSGYRVPDTLLRSEKGKEKDGR